jgi:hypothetical protein
VNALFSHDEYIDFFAAFGENLEWIRKEFGMTECQAKVWPVGLAVNSKY